MQTLKVSDFKARFSEMIDSVRAEETVVVAYGRNRKKVAALVPYDQLPTIQPRRTGTLAGIASVSFSNEFNITDEELLSL